jgi:hypothetical protein
VLHVHDLYHVQVNVSVFLNEVNSIDNDLGQGVSDLRMDFGIQRGSGNTHEKFLGDLFFLLEGF